MMEKFIFCTGAMGTMLQEKGLTPGELLETWNVLKPEVITDIHYEYIQAGSEIIETNTFGANILKYPEGSKISLEDVIKYGVNNAKEARDKSEKTGIKIALDIGPTGKLLEPMGDYKFEDAVEVFAKTIRLGVKYGVDMILIETMNDLYEAKAAIIAAKENSNLPIWITCVFNENAKMLTGSDPLAMITMFEALQVEALGLNCSLSPEKMIKTVEELKRHAKLPIIVNPNAGLPKTKDGVTYFESTPEDFAKGMEQIAKIGVDILGGCCGTTPKHIASMIEKVKNLKPQKSKIGHKHYISCYKEALELEEEIEIDRTIDMINNESLREDILSGDFDSIMDEVYDILGSADVMELCFTFPGKGNCEKEKEVYESVINILQGTVAIPIMFKTEHPEILEFVLRNYNGKAFVNMTFGLANRLEESIEIIKKYGALIDFKGIEDAKLINQIKEIM